MSLIKLAADMPLKNWSKINSEAINLKYMFTNFDEKNEINTEVINAYFDLLSQTQTEKEKETSFELYIKYIAEFQKIKIQKKINELEGIVYDETINITYSNADKAFLLYLDKLTKDDEISLNEFYFENVPESFSLIKDIQFFHISEFELFTNKFENKENYLNELFLKKHLKSRQIVVNAKKIDAELKAEFQNAGLYEKYFEVRAFLFDVNSVKKKYKESYPQYSLEFELAIIKKIADIRLTLNDNMLSEYIAAKILMNQILEQEKNQNHGKV